LELPDMRTWLTSFLTADLGETLSSAEAGRPVIAWLN
jgi:hypothetical protein